MSEVERLCLSLPKEEKIRLIDMMIKSIKTEDSCRTFEKMHDAVVKVIGCEVVTKNRERDSVIGRTILAHALASEGWSENKIGKFLHRDHSLVHKLKNDMKLWLHAPNIFKIENELYVEFLKELNHEIDG